MRTEMKVAPGRIYARPLSGGMDFGTDDTFETRTVTWAESLSSVPITGIGFVLEGAATLSGPSGEFTLQSGMFFSLPKGWTINGGSGFAVSRAGDPPAFLIGGPVESTGRLRYIDG